MPLVSCALPKLPCALPDLHSALPDLHSALPEFKKKKKLHIISVFMFSNSLQICARVFIDLPQNCAQILFRSRAGLCPNFGRSRCKLCLICCRLHAKLYPISFAPCSFPNLAEYMNTRRSGLKGAGVAEAARTHWHTCSLLFNFTQYVCPMVFK